jgi:hypothetical protein
MMERRAFIEKLLAGLAFGGVFLAAGCRKEEKVQRSGNADNLWKAIAGPQKTEEPVEIAQMKDSPAKFRDASMGKVDDSFRPKVEGG